MKPVRSRDLPISAPAPKVPTLRVLSLFLKPSLFRASLSIVKGEGRGHPRANGHRVTIILKPSLLRPLISTVKSKARGHPRANGRRVTITFKGLGQNWVPIFRPNVPRLREGCFKMSVSEFCSGSTTLNYFEPETHSAEQNRLWVPHAGGQYDGSLHKLPQTSSIPYLRLVFHR